eukprot:537957-Alexandrium_andersonii.AAC.2
MVAGRPKPWNTCGSATTASGGLFSGPAGPRPAPTASLTSCSTSALTSSVNWSVRPTTLRRTDRPALPCCLGLTWSSLCGSPRRAMTHVLRVSGR